MQVYARMTDTFRLELVTLGSCPGVSYGSTPTILPKIIWRCQTGNRKAKKCTCNVTGDATLQKMLWKKKILESMRQLFFFFNWASSLWLSATNPLHKKNYIWYQLANMTKPLSLLSDGCSIMATFGKQPMMCRDQRALLMRFKLSLLKYKNTNVLHKYRDQRGLFMRFKQSSLIYKKNGNIHYFAKRCVCVCVWRGGGIVMNVWCLSLDSRLSN